MKRTTIIETIKTIGQKVKVCGWVHAVRSHGKIIFIDLRDQSGILQTVFIPANKEAYEKVKEVRPEWVVEIEGTVGERPSGMETEKLPTGKVELLAEEVTVLNQSKTPPFELTGDSRKINEEKRLEYRYLDLRTERMKGNLILRHQAALFIREFLDKKGFLEIETPILTKSTPEGARDYIVPSRREKGKFYALPQSPQQYKQLLMVAGVEKYFQIAKCFRDEDTRGDRQPEFTQMDLEMSFVAQEDIMRLNEELLIALVHELMPQKKIQQIPFPRITYQESVKKYATDRPDLRADKNDSDSLAFCWVIDFPFFERNDKGDWTFTHNPFSAPKPEHMDWLMAKKNIADILTTQYDIVLNGYEVGGGSIRTHTPEALEKAFEIMGYQSERIQKNFGHILEALSFGAPPHGGIAWGLERLLMLLVGEESIREVMAFPKTGDGRDLMMGAPSEVESNQLKELHLKSAP
ncbi:MAG: aspartate--tRNA ligase [Candidatus Pacebacteria bacterium]|nr:aspartate--tRNA ligase [Candidatus Paceibacterota bacterium]